VEAQLKTLLAERSAMKTFSATLQPLQEAHLGSSAILFDDFNANKGDAQKIVMLGSVAFFLLLIAAFNFMNLSTARASLRAREVGMRKVHGATRSQLIRQFLLESMLLVGVAAVLGVVLLWLLEPLVSLPLAEGFVAFLLDHGQVLLTAALALFCVGLLAGFYPAFVLSSFAPIVVLKGKFANSAKGIWLRRVLVVLQFALSIAIIIGMLVVNQQLNYMRNKNPGFERDGIVNVVLNNPALSANAEILKNRLLEIPQVLAVAGSSNMPGQTFGRIGLRPFGTAAEDFFIMSRLAVDSNYMDTLSMQLLAGRNYSPNYPADAKESIMLNESAVKALGWTDAVGRTIQMGNQQRTVIGVVRDFHFADMRHQIEPVALLVAGGSPRELSIRIDRNSPREALDGIAAAWEEINPDYPFSYTFFTDEYNKLFRDDAQFSAMLNQFTFVAIIIACLGLYGLASFSADQRTREIGIRKVLGASRVSLLRLVLKEYMTLIVIANLLAWGAAWYVMQAWLAGFAYRTELPFSSFALATAGTLVLALCTIAGQCWRAANADPMKSLRYE
jgi:putative ABC transport system permease protein